MVLLDCARPVYALVVADKRLVRVFEAEGLSTLDPKLIPTDVPAFLAVI